MERREEEDEEVAAMWFEMVRFYVGVLLLRLGWLGRTLAAPRSGQSMVEYAILAALIAIVAMAAVQALGGGIATVFQNILSRISTLGSGGR
jgi:Flp pilus assembly pilin Flp